MLHLPPAFMDLGIVEILFVGVVALLVFGGDLPKVMRDLGRGYAKFKRGLQDMSRPVREEIRRAGEAADPETPPDDDAAQPINGEDVEDIEPTPEYGVDAPKDEGDDEAKDEIKDEPDSAFVEAGPFDEGELGEPLDEEPPPV